MSRNPRHAKPEEPKPARTMPSWWSVVKELSAKWWPFPKNSDSTTRLSIEPPSACVICDTYRARTLEPPKGHVCFPPIPSMSNVSVLTKEEADTGV